MSVLKFHSNKLLRSEDIKFSFSPTWLTTALTTRRPYISRICPDVPWRPIFTSLGLRVSLMEIINSARFYRNQSRGLDFVGSNFDHSHRNAMSPLTRWYLSKCYRISDSRTAIHPLRQSLNTFLFDQWNQSAEPNPGARDGRVRWFSWPP